LGGFASFVCFPNIGSCPFLCASIFCLYWSKKCARGLMKSYLLIPIKTVFCVPVDMAGNAESAPRCTNPRTGKRQLSTEKAGQKIGCAIFWETILGARSAHTGRTLLYQRFCAAKRTHRQDASIPTLLCSEAHTQAGRFYTNAFVQRSAQAHSLVFKKIENTFFS